LEYTGASDIFHTLSGKFDLSKWTHKKTLLSNHDLVNRDLTGMNETMKREPYCTKTA
jgi:hypothetical protein